LAEYGLIVAQGLVKVRQQLPDLLEDADNGLTMTARIIFADLQEQLIELDQQVTTYSEKILAVHRASPVSQRLSDVPGIGPITATAILAALGDGKAFGSARQVAAWLGLVPRQDSSGGKPKLLGISKRGDVYLRTLLIHGGRAVVNAAAKKDDAQSRWVNELVKRRNINVAAVAVANKNARVIWALLTKSGKYRVPAPSSFLQTAEVSAV
jgi:transposase